MISALLMGILGAVSTYKVGTLYFGFDLKSWAIALVVSNFSGFTSLFMTLFLERRPKFRRIFMGNAPKTWGFVTLLYIGLMAALDPALRDPLTHAVLFMPLLFSTGFMIPLWGKAQDAVLRWEYHRRLRAQQKSSNQEFAGPKRDVIRVES